MHPAPAPRLRALALALGAALLSPACAGPVDESGRKEFHAALGHTSITVFPAHVRSNTPEGTRADAPEAARLAEWLRAQGLAEARVADVACPLPEEADGFQWGVFKQDAAALGAFVREHPQGTAYALLAEYLITRTPDGGTAAGGVMVYVVDAQGRFVDALILNSHHEAFRKAAARTPAECTALVIEVLAPEWKPAG